MYRLDIIVKYINLIQSDLTYIHNEICEDFPLMSKSDIGILKHVSSSESHLYEIYELLCQISLTLKENGTN